MALTTVAEDIRPGGTRSPLLRILGPVEVEGPNGLVAIPPGRQQAVLVRLLLDANQVVATDHLVDVLWDHDPPDTSRTQVQICVSRLRKRLTAGEVAATIATRQPGYVLTADPGEIDLWIFSEGVTRARALAEPGRLVEAVAALRAVVGLWRGPSLSGITNPTLRNRALRLDAERLDAWETLLAWELELGLHHQVVGELSSLVHDHPLRERTRALYMTALHRAGRQAEALETYRVGRDLMVDELGLEPGEPLRLLEAAILSDAPSLRPPTVRVAGPAAHLPETNSRPDGAGSRPTTVGTPPVSAAPARPHQLPADIADFVPDTATLAQAEEMLLGAHRQRAVGILAVVGPAGVGKSALATHIGHRVAEEHFPDGQLYCDMQATRGESPVPADALGRFLNALGIPGPMIPVGLDERGEMYRTLLAGRRILVVIDDAPGEGHVLPLLPGSSSCAVIVTSRSRMTGLPGARRVELGPLDRGRALTLLGRVAGADRIRREPDAADALVTTVGGLPLAVRIIAARLAARPHWTLAEMVRRLDDEQHRLDELEYGEMTVRASLAVTHDGLDRSARELFSVLGVVEGPPWPGWVTGAVLGDRRPFPCDLLEPLLDAQMLDVVTSDGYDEPRFRLQDVIRLFAREKLADRPDAADAAVRRLVGGWLASLQAAHRSVYGGDYTALHGKGLHWAPPGAHLRGVADDPLAWFNRERVTLAAVIAQAAREGLDELCWDLAVTATTFYETQGNLDDWAHTHEVALRAVRAAGNERGEAALRASLGTLYVSQERPDRARTELAAAARVFEKLDEPLGIGLCHRDLALISRRAGEDERATALYARALDEFDRADDVVGRAIVLTQRAELRAGRDGLEAARADLAEAVSVQSELGYVGGVARTMRRIGQLQSAAGDHRQAVDTLAEVLGMVRDVGDLIGETHLLRNLGEATEAAGMYEQAALYFQDALTACDRILDRRGAAMVRPSLARCLARTGRAAPAAERGPRTARPA